jgi:hypothetical protein
MEKTLFFTFFATAALPEYNVNGNIILVQGNNKREIQKIARFNKVTS